MKKLVPCVIATCLLLTTACDDEPPAQDAGPGEIDAGPPAPEPDAGPPEPMACNTVGRSGGTCRAGSQCVTGLTCYGENVRADLTLGTFEIPDGTEDPAHPGEYLPGEPSTIPVAVTPGGLCTEGCSTEAAADTCGSCSFCNDAIGGPSAFGAIGLDVSVFDATDLLGAGEDGVCRARCEFDPATDGGCPTGSTCDPRTNTCVERCLTDAQCNVSFGTSVEVGLVATRVPGEPYTCSMTTGRCEHPTPSGATLGTDCDSDADCEASNGFCFAGHCSRLHCAGSDGALAGGTATCAADAMACVRLGGNGSSACVGLCDTADDCFADQACDPAGSPVMDASGRAWAGLCVLPCSGDSECQMDRVCDATVQRFNNASLGICAPFCDPGATGLAGAVTCEASEACVAIPGDAMGRGLCKAQDNLCAVHEVCANGQACRVVGANLNGRCEDGCTGAADCAAGEQCLIVDTDPDDGVAQTIGVCVAPGGACSPSPRRADGTPLRLLRGVDGSAQCVPGQVCVAPIDGMTGMPTVNAMGTCMDAP